MEPKPVFRPQPLAVDPIVEEHVGDYDTKKARKLAEHRKAFEAAKALTLALQEAKKTSSDVYPPLDSDDDISKNEK
ncbi:MAG: hypothetical protein WCV88_01300 [Patescibacteria group bacterium]|jgi:hypothetical protein